MIARLLDLLERPVTFIVGKGGVGKTTTAGGIALALADRGEEVRLLSTDPAHSLGDLFGAPADGPSPCTPRLVLEELDAEGHARRRLHVLESALAELIDRGTYLDPQDAASLLEGSLPGLDEIGAALRIQEILGDSGRLIVDTAPTGHMLRMLDAPSVVDGWVRVFRAMAAKADTVASALVGRAVRLTGEDALDELAGTAAAFADGARDADFVIVTGPGEVVRAETARLREALTSRGIRVAATVAAARPGAEADLILPFQPGLSGCDALRSWIDGTVAGAGTAGEATRRGEGTGRAAPAGRRSIPLADILDRELVVFAGKGGVGKTTCAAAAAVLLAERGPVLLAGADPAGSLHDVLPDPPDGVEIRELDAEREMERFRDLYRGEVERAFEAAGLDRTARMDRDIVESLWGLAPPGIDEVVAVARLAETEDGEPRRTVLDTAPTGHFIRLLAMPDLAGDWVRRLLRLILKYRALGGLDSPAESLVRFARRLRALQERLSDPSRTAILIVTLDEPLVQAETRRLLRRLDRHGLAAAAVVVNRARRGGAWPPEDDAPAPPVFRAPEVEEPVGAGRLRSLVEAWEVTP